MTWTAGPAASASAGTFAALNRPAVQAVAQDGVAMVATIFAPATTRLVFAQGEESEFGYEVEQRLRARGFMIDVAGGKAKDDISSRIFLRYVVDKSGNVIRATYVGWDEQENKYITLSRGYVVKQGDVYPAGLWSRQD